MSFRIQDVIVQADQVRLAEDEIEILVGRQLCANRFGQ